MKRLKGAVLAVLALAVAGQLYAQPVAPAPDDTAPAASPASRRLSAAEMQQSVLSLEEQLRVDTQHVQHLQAIARREKDVVKLSCVNDKMVKLKAEANLFDQARLNLAGVLDRDDRFTAYDNVTAAADRVHKLREEADGCAGELELSSESGNSFVGPDVPDDPTDGLPFDDGVVGGTIEPPAYASPFN